MIRRAAPFLLMATMCVACPETRPEPATQDTVPTPSATPDTSAAPLLTPPAVVSAAPSTAPSSAPPDNGRGRELPQLDAGVLDGGQRPTRPDADIVRDIEHTIRDNSVLSAQGAKVRVTCDHGEVTLRGTVKDEAAHASVTAMVRKTPGVLRIKDLLKAIDPHPTDWNPDDPKY